MPNIYEFLAQLLMQGGNKIAQGTKKLGQGIEKGLETGVNIAGQTLQPMFPGLTSLPQISSEEGEKVLRKGAKTQAEQILQKEGPQVLSELINQQKSQLPQETTGTPDMIMGGLSKENLLPNQNQQIQNDNNPMINQQGATGLLSALLGSGGVKFDKETNTYTLGNVGLLPALLTGFSGKPAQQYQMESVANLQKLMGLEPLQKGEKEKMSMEQKNRLEQIETEYGYKLNLEAVKVGLDPKNPAVVSSLFMNDFTDLINAYENLPLKGRVGGRVGGLGGALGIGREKRQELETLNESFIYSFGNYIWNQTGRALDQKEVEQLRKNVAFNPNMTASQKLGKIQAIINLANNRLKQSGKTPLPDAKTFLSQVKGQSNQISTSNIKSITPMR